MAWGSGRTGGRRVMGVLALAVTTSQSPVAAGQAPAATVWRLDNLTRGIRHDPPLIAFAESASQPGVAYLGTGKGLIYVTRDGGRSWEEQRVRVPRERFVGAIRPQPAARGPGLDDARNPFDRKASEALSLTNAQVPDNPVSRGRFEGVRVDAEQWELRRYDQGFESTPELLRGGGGGGGARLGVGLRAGSPRLSLALRKKRGWAIGINMKQTLSLVASPPTLVVHLDVHPEDPDDVFAATHDGLLHSTDGGDSWPIALTGASARERKMRHVVRRPGRPGEVWVATAVGLQVSVDGGESFTRVLDSRLAQMAILRIHFHPAEPDTVFIGTQSGLFRSTDGGREYDWVFVRPWPAQNRIRRIALDPANPATVLIATDDGLFISRDGGDRFERAGGLLFTGERMKDLRSSGRPGHFIVATRRDLWETRDGGESWRVLYYGATEWTIEMALFSLHDPGAIWLVTWAEMLQLVPRAAQRSPPGLESAWRRRVAEDPPRNEVVMASLRRAGVHIGDRAEYRQRSRWAGLLPRVDVALRFRDLDASGAADRRELDFQGRLARDALLGRTSWTVFAWWDVGRIVHSRDETLIGRVFGENKKAYWRIQRTVVDMYLERRRLQLEDLLDPDPAARTRVLRRLRLEELTAHLNYLSGDLLPPVAAF